MMIDPPIDKLVDKVGCKYALVVVTSKRARTLLEKRAEDLDKGGLNPVTEAAKELYAGSVIAKTED